MSREREELARENLVALSRWIDAGNKQRDPEAVTWGRLAKINTVADRAGVSEGWAK